MAEEYEEITLADLVNTIWRRKFVLLAVFLLCLGGGIAFTASKVPTYQASATVIPLEHPDIIANYLNSRQAGGDVAQDKGDALLSRIFAGQWDDDAGAWINEPTTEQAAGAISGMVSVTRASEGRQETAERKITIHATHTDPALARDVANAMMDALIHLRPTFENITVEQKFEVYYDGQNEQAARQRAEQVAKEKEYWLELDRAVTPGGPNNLNPTLNISLAVVLGLMLGVFTVFVWEWASKYRAEIKGLKTPEDRFGPER